MSYTLSNHYNFPNSVDLAELEFFSTFPPHDKLPYTAKSVTDPQLSAAVDRELRMAVDSLARSKLTWNDLLPEANADLAAVRRWAEFENSAVVSSGGLEVHLSTLSDGSPAVFFPIFASINHFSAFLEGNVMDNGLQGIEHFVRKFTITYHNNAPNLAAAIPPPSKDCPNAPLRKSELQALLYESILWNKFWSQHALKFARLEELVTIVPKPLIMVDSTPLAYLTHANLGWSEIKAEEYQDDRCIMLKNTFARILAQGHPSTLLFSDNIHVDLPEIEAELRTKLAVNAGKALVKKLPKSVAKRLPDAKKAEEKSAPAAEEGGTSSAGGWDYRGSGDPEQGSREAVLRVSTILDRRGHGDRGLLSEMLWFSVDSSTTPEYHISTIRSFSRL